MTILKVKLVHKNDLEKKLNLCFNLSILSTSKSKLIILKNFELKPKYIYWFKGTFNISLTTTKTYYVTVLLNAMIFTTI